MGLKKYNRMTYALWLVSAMALSSCSRPAISPNTAKTVEAIVREQDEAGRTNASEKIIAGSEYAKKGNENLKDFAISLSPEMSKDELKESIISIVSYRTEKEINDILSENKDSFTSYNPLSELKKFEKRVRKSYDKLDKLTMMLSPKKFIRARKDIREIQNNVLDEVYEDTINGRLGILTDAILGKYYTKVVEYEKLRNVYSDFYELGMDYFEKKENNYKSAEEEKKMGEKKTFVKMLFEREDEYLKSIYF